jgi:glutamate formiminotransferase/formiminotetrahydrofolate cyclodeaminase
MVANLSAHKRGWDERWEEFSKWAVMGEKLRHELLFLVDEDTRAYDRIIACFGMPRTSEAEQQARKAAIAEATKGAILVPLRTMQVCVESMALMQAMATDGMPASVSDAGVGALCARTGAIAAYLNVRINCAGLEDEGFKTDVLRQAEELRTRAEALEAAVMKATLAKV